MTRRNLRKSDASKRDSWNVAVSGLLAMAAALGIGRFVYTPILPEMIDSLGWCKADAGLRSCSAAPSWA